MIPYSRLLSRKYPGLTKKSYNSGDDIAGTIQSIGSNVTEFHIGDRVSAFHTMGKPYGSFAEFAIAPANTTFHIPAKTSFEDAATVPLAAMTAVVGLFDRLGLPEPWQQGRQDGKPGKDAKETGPRAGPLLVYGAASAVGAFAIQLAKRANIGPIIGVAGKGIPFVESLLDKSAGDAVIDYRKGDEAVVSGIKAALPAGKKLYYCYDAVSEKGSFNNAAKVLEQQGSKITLVLPGADYSAIPAEIEKSVTYVGDVHSTQTDLGFAWFRLFGKGLAEGWLKPHPVEVVKGGLGGVSTGLKNLKDGKASAVKYVFKVSETPGAKI